MRRLPLPAQDQYRVDSRDAWESNSGSSFSFVYRPRVFRQRLSVASHRSQSLLGPARRGEPHADGVHGTAYSGIDMSMPALGE